MTNTLEKWALEDAVKLARREVEGTHLLTCAEYRKVARALVQLYDQKVKQR